MRSAESVVNPNRRLLYELYADMKLAGRLLSVTEKRILNILNADFTFTGSDGKPDEQINKLIKKRGFKKMLRHIVESKLYGYSLVYLTPELESNNITTSLIDRRHVKPQSSIVVRNSIDTIGINYKEPPIDRYAIGIGEEDDLGIILAACQYVIYKRGGFGDWAQFAELFGMPFRKGKYDGYDEEARKKLEFALDKAGSAAYMVIPEGTDVEFVQNSGNSGSNDVYKSLKDACNEEITTIILGNTLTTSQGDKGARSLGDVHKETEDDIFKSDRDLALQILNEEFIQFLILHGWNANGGEFSIPDKDHLTKKERLDMDLKIANRQPVSDDHFYETYGVPKPDNYDAMKKIMEDAKAAKLKPPTLPSPNPVPSKKKTKDSENLIKQFFNLFS